MSYLGPTGAFIEGSLITTGDSNLNTGSSYKINNVDILNYTTLGSSVVNSSLTSVGTLNNLTVAGDATFDTNTLKVDSINNRVGVGSATPAYTLDVVGNANLNTGSSYKINGSDVLTGNTLGSGIVNSSLITVGTLNNLTVSGDLTVDTNTLKVDTVNNRVGVGSATPAYTLDIVGNTNLNTGSSYKINGSDVLTGNTLGSGIVNSSLTTVGTLSSLAVSGDATFDTNTLKVDSINNRVGVGSATPAYTLDIVGNTNLNTGSSYKINGSDVLSGNTLGSGVVNSSLTSVGTLSSLAVSGNLTVDTNTLKVDAVNNRVGVGSATPAYTLDVVGNANLNTGSSYKINGSDVLTGNTLGSGVVNSSLTSVGTLNNLTVSGDATFDTNTLKVDSVNNKVGIKNASPDYELDVNGTINSTYSVITSNSFFSNALNFLQKTIPTLGSEIGYIDFRGVCPDSTNRRGALIIANSSGTWSDISTPSYLTFNTTPSGSITNLERMRIGSDGNIGIGTSAPEVKLDVRDGNIKSDASIPIIAARKSGTSGQPTSSIMVDSTGPMLLLDDAVQSNLSSLGGGADYFYIRRATATGDTTFQNARSTNATTTQWSMLNNGDSTWGTFATERMRLLASNGNVGIGTNAPAVKLEISDSTNAGLRINNLANATSYGFQTKSDRFSIARYAGGGNFNDDLVINSSGNVGIGTTNPGATLDVRGDIAIPFSNSQGLMINSPQSFTRIIRSYYNATLLRDVLDLQPGGSSGSIIIFRTGSGSSGERLERVRIDTSGNVGIGTTNPQDSLHVVSTSNPLRLETINSGCFIEFFNNSSTRTHYIGPNNSTSPIFVFSNEVDNTGAFRFLTTTSGSSSERFRIANNGNVGIGDSNPSHLLSVSGTISAGRTFAPSNYDSLTQTDSKILFYDNTGQNWSGIGVSSDGRWWLRTGTSSTNLMTMGPDGNIGIGTSNASDKLHVQQGYLRIERYENSSVNGAAIRMFFGRGDGITNTAVQSGDVIGALFPRGYDGTSYSNTADSAIRMLADENFTTTAHGTRIDFQTKDNGTNIRSTKMTIKNDGKVGIGTDNPNEKLEMNGNLLINVPSNETGKIIGKHASAVSNTELTLYQPLTGNAILQTNFSTGNILFNTNGANERMRITSTGNVGIGTNNPGSRFHVYQINPNLIQDVSGFQVILNPNSTSGTAVSTLRMNWYSDTFDIIGYRGGDVLYSRFGFTHAGSERLTITSTGTVGIGITNPSSDRLDVNGTIRVRGSRLYMDNAGGNLFEIGPSAGSGDSTLFGFYAPPNRGISLFAGGTERIRLTSTGRLNFNVGTSGVTLDIAGQNSGTINFGNGASDSSLPIIVSKSSNSTGLYLLAATSNTNVNSDMKFDVREDDNTDFADLTRRAFSFTRFDTNSLMTILRNGNVGIGTNDPSTYRLSVIGDINFTGSLLQNGSPFGSSQWVSSGSNIYYNTGNVGIQRTNPDSRLHISGGRTHIDSTSTTFNTGVGLRIGSATNYATFNYVIPATGTEYLLIQGTREGVGNNRNISLNPIGGNVGIGITNPERRLHVADQTFIGYQAGVSGGLYLTDTATYGAPAIQSLTSTFGGSNLILNPIGSGDIQIGRFSSDYQHIRMGGGNSYGYLFGSFLGVGDGINISYNHYYNASGAIQYINTSSGANNASIQVGYGTIIMRTGLNNTPPTERLRIINSGNIGINTSSPVSQLTIRSRETGPESLGDGYTSIRLENANYGNDGGPGPGITFAQRWWSGNTETVRTGRINGVRTMGDGLFGGGIEIYTQPFSSGDMIRRMIIDHNGFVGIGTGNPQYPLHVVNSISTTFGAGWEFSNIIGPSQKGSYTNNFTIFSQTGVAGQIFYAFSDRRIKENITDVDDEIALNSLRLLKPKKYSYIDKSTRTVDTVLGFIAQDVKEVLPHAVSLMKNIIPDIISYGNVINNIITLLKNHYLTVDTRVKIIQENGKENVFTVTEIIDDFSFKVDNHTDLTEKVFIYGREVDDFHALDKNTIYTINVAATQELDRQVQLLKEENILLKEKNAALEERLAAIEAKLGII